jgi:hypothetical protein
MTTAPSPLTPPDDLIRLITEAQAFIKTTQGFVDDYKAQLTAHYEAGDCFDKLSTSHGTATSTIRTTHSYTPAVDALKKAERDQGLTTQKTSVSWTITPAKPEA